MLLMVHPDRVVMRPLCYTAARRADHPLTVWRRHPARWTRSGHLRTCRNGKRNPGLRASSFGLWPRIARPSPTGGAIRYRSTEPGLVRLAYDELLPANWRCAGARTHASSARPRLSEGRLRAHPQGCLTPSPLQQSGGRHPHRPRPTQRAAPAGDVGPGTSR